MPRWWISAAIQRRISLLSARNYWNEWFQEHVTRSVECTAGRFESHLKKSRRHLEYYRDYTSGGRSAWPNWPQSQPRIGLTPMHCYGSLTSMPWWGMLAARGFRAERST
jgi:hypothetical protein